MLRKLLIQMAIVLLASAALAAEVKEVAPGIYFRFGDIARGQANGGFIVCDDHVVAIEAPNAEAANEMFAEVKKITDKPIRKLIITHGHWDHDGGVNVFLEKGVEVFVEESVRAKYVEQKKPGKITGVVAPGMDLTDGGRTISIAGMGTCHSPGDLFVGIQKDGVLFTGDTVVSTQACWLGDCSLQNWIDSMNMLSDVKDIKVVCPGHGPAGGPELMANLATYLTRLRDEVAFQVTMGRSYEIALAQVKLPENEKFGSKGSLKDHVKAAYAQLTADPPVPKEPVALVLIGDRYHPPSYIRPPLESALGKIGMPVQFIYDVTKLNAAALKNARLLVVLRDGMIWPKPTADKPDGEAVWWMTGEQEKAIADFVSNGGGFLALHNATALRRIDAAGSLYRDVLGSSYNGHGAGDEKFAVKPIVTDHPVTKGVTEYPAIDERHNPTMHAKDATILLQAISGDKTSVNGYVRTFGKGRVCHLANGHNIEMLACPAMQQLIANAANWCCAKE